MMLRYLIAMAVALVAPVAASAAIGDEPTPYLVDNNVIAKVECGKWVGTGVYVGNGLVATARHVVEDGHCTAGGVAAEVVASSLKPSSDFALLKIDGRAPYRALIDCGGLKEGELYLATGYAEGADATVTQLLVGTSSRSTEPGFQGLMIFRGSVTQGMSGGAIVKLLGGAFVGIISANSDDGITQVLGLPLADTTLCRKG
jgi:S1-C subfamily serine protease